MLTDIEIESVRVAGVFHSTFASECSLVVGVASCCCVSWYFTVFWVVV